MKTFSDNVCDTYERILYKHSDSQNQVYTNALINGNMFETISIPVFTIYMSNFKLCEQRKVTDGSVTMTITSNNCKR